MYLFVYVHIYIYIHWDQPVHCNGHHKQKHKKSTREIAKFCTSHDHTPGRLEPESVHVVITFQVGRGPVKQRKYYRICMAFALGSVAK